MTPIEIKLTPFEMAIGGMAAVYRRTQNIALQTNHAHNAKDVSWDNEIHSCWGEVAVARHMNLFWTGAAGDWSMKDVGGFLQVRATSHPRGRLLVHSIGDKVDADTDPFVHVIVVPRTGVCRIMGWMMGDRAKTFPMQELQPGRPAHVVPNEVLNDMDKLKGVVWVAFARKYGR